MNEAGVNEACSIEEFPKMPKDFKGFHVSPSNVIPLKINEPTTITLRNTSSYPVLYKIKCTSNNRVSILDCAGILLPEHETPIMVYRHDRDVDANDRFLVLYTLVGMQWCAEDANALHCWRRANAQQVPTKSMIIPAKLDAESKSKEVHGKGKGTAHQ